MVAGEDVYGRLVVSVDVEEGKAGLAGVVGKKEVTSGGGAAPGGADGAAAKEGFGGGGG